MKQKKDLIVWVMVITLVAFSCQDPSNISERKTLVPKSEWLNEQVVGKLQTLQVGSKAIKVKEYQDQYLYQGDIVLTPELIESLKSIEGGRSLGSILQHKIWPTTTIPYNIANASLRNSVDNAVAILSAVTNLNFVEHYNESSYIRFVESDINASPVGFQGGRQDVQLVWYASTGTVIHEICHALGMWHEQSRQDRDNFVQIHWENIEDNEGHNFDKELSFDHGPFDFTSIMMYGSYDFSKNGLPTITRLDGSVFPRQRTNLSAGDLDALLDMYPGQFISAPGSVDIGAGGGAFMIVSGLKGQTQNLQRWNGSSWDAFSKPTSAMYKVDVDAAGNPWVTGGGTGLSYNLYRYTGSSWISMASNALDVGISEGNDVYMVQKAGTAKVPKYKVLQYNGSGWTQLGTDFSAAVTSITARSNGEPWIIQSGAIKRYSAGQWITVGGPRLNLYEGVTDISAGGGNSMYALSRNAKTNTNRIFVLTDASGWLPVKSGAADSFEADFNGHIFY